LRAPVEFLSVQHHPVAQEHTMQKQARKNLRKNRGQGMTEYIIIVALIAIAAIGVITLFGDNIRKLFGSSANALAGSTSEQNRGNQTTDALEKKTIQSFGENNAY
jgi:pilus assembly protein Flp/PilA